MRERCWFIPEQVLKGKLPYRNSETFYGPPNPFLLAVVYYIGGIGLTPERATGFAYRLIFLGAMFCLARRWNSTVASGCTLFATLFLVSLGVAAYAWTGRLACALCSIYLLAQAESRQCGRGPLPMARFSSVRILVSPQCCQHYRFFGDPSSGEALVSLRCGCGPVPSRMPHSCDRSTAGTGKLIRLSCSAIQRQPSYPFAAVEKPTLILRTSDRVLDQPGGGMASNTG